MYFIGTTPLGLPARHLSAASQKMLEAVGLVPVFSIADTTIDIVVILATRRLTHRLISLYMAITLCVLSLLQGLTPQRLRTSLDYVTIVALALSL